MNYLIRRTDVQIFLRICLSSALLLTSATAIIALPQAASIRRVDLAGGNGALTLAGTVHPLARPEFDQGPVNPRTPMGRMVLLLKPSATRQAALDALVAAQQDPASPQFHQWLTPVQYGALFGASDADLSRVTAWLRQDGFSIENIQPSRRAIVFSGTAGQVFEAFRTRIDRYRVNGMLHLANAQNLEIPDELADVVTGVVSLNDFHHRPQLASHPLAAVPARLPAPPVPPPLRAQPSVLRAQFNSGSDHYLFPADFATIYDLAPLYSAGTEGGGTSIAIAGRSSINLVDVSAFRTTAGLPANPPAVILAGADPGLVAGDRDEATLDVEWAGAIAPAASIKLVTAASTAATDGVDLAAQYIVNHALAQVVSVSYGSCEQAMGPAELAFYNGLWEQAASQGMSVFVAAGDAGAAGCSDPADAAATAAAVNGLCSSPYATCVGGTQFDDGAQPGAYWSAANGAGYNSALQYIPEVVWNESGTSGGAGLWASGGGISTVYAQPAWQAAVAGTEQANAMRAVPDVSLAAAQHDGYIVYENGSYSVAYGTSAATPAFAALMALVVESRGAVQGSANPTFYALAAAESSPFHATGAGNNSVPGVPGYAANGAPYNLATGLGSVDAAHLVEGWGGTAAAAGAPWLTLDVAAQPLALAGSQGTLELTAVTGGSFSGDITLIAGGLPVGMAAQWSANPVAAAGASSTPVSLTLKTAPWTPPGSFSIVITAAGGGLSATQRITVTVRRPPACRYELIPSHCGLRPVAPRIGSVVKAAP